MKHILKIKELLKGTSVFTSSDIERIVGDKSYAHLLLHNLVKKEEVFRIKKGWYSTVEDPSLSVFCFKPSYLGLQNALSFHGLWEQETNPVIITGQKPREGVRKIFGNNVVIRHLNPKYLFGFSFFEKGDYSIPVSDIEKTLLDLIYFKEDHDKKLIKKLKERSNKKKLEGYAKKYNISF